jgi:hypothetical protein
VPDGATPDDREQDMTGARQYFIVRPSFKGCVSQSMSREVTASLRAGSLQSSARFQRAIQAGRDARHFWFALREWRGDDPQRYFGDLGVWAERRMKELGVDSAMPRIVLLTNQQKRFSKKYTS